MEKQSKVKVEAELSNFRILLLASKWFPEQKELSRFTTFNYLEKVLGQPLRTSSMTYYCFLRELNDLELCSQL